ncbi:hypothetical protein LTR94_031953, partial [Friedmanniomyces endolithicus]
RSGKARSRDFGHSLTAGACDPRPQGCDHRYRGAWIGQPDGDRLDGAQAAGVPAGRPGKRTVATDVEVGVRRALRPAVQLRRRAEARTTTSRRSRSTDPSGAAASGGRGPARAGRYRRSRTSAAPRRSKVRAGIGIDGAGAIEPCCSRLAGRRSVCRRSRHAASAHRNRHPQGAIRVRARQGR